MQGFFPHFAGFPGIDAHAGLFVGSAAAGAHIDASARQVIHHGNALGDANRMVIGQDDYAKTEADVFGEAAEGSEDNLRAWGHAEGGEKVMLYEPHVVETHLVGETDLLDGFFDHGVVVQLRTLHFVS